MEILRENRVAALAAATLAAGVAAGVSAEQAAAWEFKTRAVAESYCPVGATEQVTSPIDLTFNNKDGSAMVVDGVYNDKDVDFRELDEETGKYGPVEEELVVDAGKTAVAQLVDTVYVPGKKVDLTLRWNWKKSTSTDKSSVPVEFIKGAPCEEVPITTGTTPQPESSTTTPADTTTTTTPEKTRQPRHPVDRAEKLNIKKWYTGISREINIDGKTYPRVRPYEHFGVSLRVTFPNDGDKYKNEVLKNVRVQDIMPKDERGRVLMKASTNGGRTFNVLSVGKTIKSLREGQSKVVRFYATTTPAAANPPRIVENCAVVRKGGSSAIIDRSCAPLYDPMSRSNAADPLNVGGQKGVYVSSR